MEGGNFLLATLAALVALIMRPTRIVLVPEAASDLFVVHTLDALA